MSSGGAHKQSLHASILQLPRRTSTRCGAEAWQKQCLGDGVQLWMDSVMSEVQNAKKKNLRMTRLIYAAMLARTLRSQDVP